MQAPGLNPDRRLEGWLQEPLGFTGPSAKLYIKIYDPTLQAIYQDKCSFEASISS